MNRLRVAFFTVMPSPYQRDLFSALADRDEIALSVFYQQQGAGDSPWEKAQMLCHETQLPGYGLDLAGARFHWNSRLPATDTADLWVVNASLTSPSAQWMMRNKLRKTPWLFWGEQIKPTSFFFKRRIQSELASALRGARGIVAVGSRAMRDYQMRYPDKRVWNIPYHCDLQPYINIGTSRSRREQVVFFFCGQLIHRKGVDVLLEAFGSLCAERLPVRLLLAGREGELRELCANLTEDARNRIEYAGFIQPGELANYFSKADVFVLPSRYDGWGVVVNQALGAGLPVICSSEVRAGDDLVEHESNGMIVKSGDAVQLAEAMRKFVQTEEFRLSASARSREKSYEWTVEAGVRKWLDVFNEVLGTT